MFQDVFTPIIVITFYVNLTVSIYAHTLQPLNFIVKKHPRILFSFNFNLNLTQS